MYSDKNTTTQDLMVRFSKRIGGSELYNKESSISQAFESLEGLKLGEVLFELSAIQILLANEGLKPEVNTLLLNYYLDPYQKKRLLGFVKKTNDSNVIIFSSQTIQILTQIARNVCDQSDLTFRRLSSPHLIGRAVLIVNDLLTAIDAPKEKIGEDRAAFLDRMTPSIIRQGLFVDTDQLRYELPRCKLIFDTLVEGPHRTYCPQKAIREVLNIEFDDYLFTAFVMATLWANYSLKDWNWNMLVISKQDIQRIFSLKCTSRDLC